MLSRMDKFVLKLKTKTGYFILRGLTKNSTVRDLKVQLSEKSKIQMSDLHVMVGFPPRPINLNNNSATLPSVGVNCGDTLIIEERKAGGRSAKDAKARSRQNCNRSLLETLNHKGLLMRRIVPADNSCLFTSIGFALSGEFDSNCVPHMRELVAEHVALDQETYSEAVLGNRRDEYCRWIKKPDSWGGAIELSVLSGYYGIEMDVVDTVNAIINRFGEDKNYTHRVFLLFDGIHYDPLYAELNGNEIQTVFPVTDKTILEDASILAHKAKLAGQFTDLNGFCLKCLVCQDIMVGQLEAREHAMATGHQNFGEIEDTGKK